MRRGCSLVAACLAVLWFGTGLARAGESRSFARLLAALWPERVAALAGGGLADPAGWAAADRRAVWTRILYQNVRQPPSGREAQPPAARVLPPLPEAVLEGLPADRDIGPEVGGALRSPEGGEGGDTCPALVRGELPWPAKGRRVAVGRAVPSGLVLATDEGEAVRAVADGRAVFVGRLRGLGRVVIVAHGPHCHTVQACLAEVAVDEGDAVSRDMLLGRTGFCPPARGAGVYFELRFREKALNPAEWFAASP